MLIFCYIFVVYVGPHFYMVHNISFHLDGGYVSLGTGIVERSQSLVRFDVDICSLKRSYHSDQFGMIHDGGDVKRSETSGIDYSGIQTST